MSAEVPGEKSYLERPETQETIRTIVQRVSARLERGDPQPMATVPEEKTVFPKILCLDQNKWIDLGRAHYGRSDGDEFKGALAAIRRAVTNKRLIVPILASNLAEVSHPSNEARRRRLAEFMVEISGNTSMVNPRPLRRCELKHALASMFVKTRGRCPRSGTVRWGVFAALGREPSSDNPMLHQVLYEPELSVLAMVHATGRDSVEAMRNLDKKAAAVAITARNAGLDADTRRLAEYGALFASGTTADQLLEVAAELQIPRAALDPWLEANLVAFAEAVPSIDVASRLLLARDKNSDHKTHQNDLLDFAFLKVAIPYGNIVVTENSWAHLANDGKLGERYQTTILADARSLPEVLKAEGCL